MSKRSPSARSRAVAQLGDLELADHVAGRLAGIVEVALDLPRCRASRERRLAGNSRSPARGSSAWNGCRCRRPAGSRATAGSRACRTRNRIAVEAHLLAEPLGIEAPAFDIGAVAAEAAELGQAGKLLRQRDLEMVARRAFMIGDRLDLGLQHLVHVGEVDVEDAGPRAVGRGPVVEGDRGGVLAQRLDRADLERRLGQPAEPARRRRHHLGDDRARVGEICSRPCVGVRIFELGVGAHVVEELLRACR